MCPAGTSVTDMRVQRRGPRPQQIPLRKAASRGDLKWVRRKGQNKTQNAGWKKRWHFIDFSSPLTGTQFCTTLGCPNLTVSIVFLIFKSIDYHSDYWGWQHISEPALPGDVNIKQAFERQPWETLPEGGALTLLPSSAHPVYSNNMGPSLEITFNLGRPAMSSHGMLT